MIPVISNLSYQTSQPFPPFQQPDFAGPWPARIVELCNSGGVSSSLGFSQEAQKLQKLGVLVGTN